MGWSGRGSETGREREEWPACLPRRPRHGPAGPATAPRLLRETAKQPYAVQPEAAAGLAGTEGWRAEGKRGGIASVSAEEVVVVLRQHRARRPATTSRGKTRVFKVIGTTSQAPAGSGGLRSSGLPAAGTQPEHCGLPTLNFPLPSASPLECILRGRFTHFAPWDDSLFSSAPRLSKGRGRLPSLCAQSAGSGGVTVRTRWRRGVRADIFNEWLEPSSYHWSLVSQSEAEYTRSHTARSRASLVSRPLAHTANATVKRQSCETHLTFLGTVFFSFQTHAYIFRIFSPKRFSGFM